VRDGARIRADGAADAGANEARQRVLLEARDRLALPVRGGAEVERHALGADAFDDARVARADHAVRNPLDAEVESLLDAGRLARLARVAREVQAGRARGLERGPLRRRRVARLVP